MPIPTLSITAITFSKPARRGSRSRDRRPATEGSWRRARPCRADPRPGCQPDLDRGTHLLSSFAHSVGELTTKKLQRGTHRTVRELNTDIRAWIDSWNDNPRPYVWTKTADQILDSIARYCTRINDSRH
jgi:hypothetical protein